MIKYLEVVTDKFDETVHAYEASLGLSFEGPIAELGYAKIVKLPNEGMIGVRKPMHESETPVVRPYILVDSLEAELKKIEQTDADIALPFMELPGYGKIAIYFLGENQFGLWQNET